MRYLLLLVLCFPTIVSANFRERTPMIIGDYFYASDGSSWIGTSEAIIYDGDIIFNTEEESRNREYKREEK